MSTCGNRKFTGTMPDGKMKLYFKGGAFLGWSILGRMESDKGVVCPLTYPQEEQEIQEINV